MCNPWYASIFINVREIFDSRESHSNRGDSIFYGRLLERELPQVFQTITPVAAKKPDTKHTLIASRTCWRVPSLLHFLHLLLQPRFLLPCTRVPSIPFAFPVFSTSASATNAISVLWIFERFQHLQSKLLALIVLRFFLSIVFI